MLATGGSPWKASRKKQKPPQEAAHAVRRQRQIMRVFVAIELNDVCRAALVRAAAELRERVPGVRWVRPESLHLTMQFVGDIDERDVPDVIESLLGVVAPRFEMHVTGISGFPRRGVLRVIHAGVVDDDGDVLAPLHAAIDVALGMKPDPRGFVPHVTLGRVKKSGQALSASDLATDTWFGRVGVDSFVLMRSELRRGGAVYDVVHRFPLRPRT